MDTLTRTFDEHEIHITKDDDGEVWFVAKDVCDALTISNATRAVSRLDDDEKGVTTMKARSGAVKGHLREVNIINEAGIYRLIFTSRKDAAERFKRWLAHDVLPTLRKTGSYSTQQEEELDTSTETRALPGHRLHSAPHTDEPGLALTRPLVIIDLETTSLDPQEAEITEIAALRVVEQRGDLYVQDELVEADVAFAGIAKRLAYLLQDADLAGHNIARHDVPVLRRHFVDLGYQGIPGPSNRRLVDTLKIEQIVNPHTLGATYERRFGSPIDDAHTAEVDAKASFDILLDQLEDLPLEGHISSGDIVSTYEGTLDNNGRFITDDQGYIVMNFSKHKGTRLVNVDRDFVQWMWNKIPSTRPYIAEAFK